MLVLGPFAIVCIALKIGEFTVAARFVVFPLAHVTVTVRMYHAAVAMTHVVLPEALETGFVLILHDADPVPDELLRFHVLRVLVEHQLTLVNASVVQIVDSLGQYEFAVGDRVLVLFLGFNNGIPVGIVDGEIGT